MMIPNPYKEVADFQFWRRSVSGRSATDVDPVVTPSFEISRSTQVATAGSCFAQHIAKTLQSSGYGYMIAETGPTSLEATDESFGVFTARFGNIYTIRQLLQLFDRAYALYVPSHNAWQRADGRFVDPFRPMVQAAGFSDAGAVEADRAAHFASVRKMFEECDVFIFTLGLTEGWISKIDGAVFPLAPGVVGIQGNPEDYAFRNFTVAEMESELAEFVQCLRKVNPSCKILLTVSPVALIATYEREHVLVATTYSKSALRVVAETVSRRFKDVDYFPSYEIITGPQSGGRFYEPDLREVRPEGVAYVMSLFKKHYLRDTTAELPRPVAGEAPPFANFAAELERMQSVQGIICDEERIEASL